MKKLTSNQMADVEGGLIEGTLVQGRPSSFTGASYQIGAVSPMHYSALDCVGFGGSLVALGLAVVGTGGLAIFGGLLGLGTLAASAGDCEGWLNGK